MSSPRQLKKQKRVSKEMIEIQACENEEPHAVYIPSSRDSGWSDSESDSEGCSNNIEKNPNVTYRQVVGSYKDNQPRLEPHHDYKWAKGEKKKMILILYFLMLQNHKYEICQFNYLSYFF